MNKTYYPILITVYDRFEHLKQCISSLQENVEAEKIVLYVSSDAAKSKELEEKIALIRAYVKKIKSFKRVNLLEWKTNLGALESVKRAKKIIFSTYDALICMEDDNIVSPYFYSFINDNLNYWKNNSKVAYVCGYMYPIHGLEKYNSSSFFIKEFNAWGYGMWRDKYSDVFELPLEYFDKKNMQKLKEYSHASYYIVCSDIVFKKVYGDGRRAFQLVKEEAYSIFPKYSLVKNIGHDGSGRHCGVNNHLQNIQLNLNFRPEVPHKLCMEEEVQQLITKYRSYSILFRLRIHIGRLYHKLFRCFLKR